MQQGLYKMDDRGDSYKSQLTDAGERFLASLQPIDKSVMGRPEYLTPEGFAENPILKWMASHSFFCPAFLLPALKDLVETVTYRRLLSQEGSVGD